MTMTDKPSTLIVGLGKTGFSCVKCLVAEGVPVAVTDSREHPPYLDVLKEEYPDVAVFLGGFSDDAFKMAQQIVISPGVSRTLPEIQQAENRGLPILGDIELFAHRCKAPVIAITGSNGKSTVTAIVNKMIKAAGYKVSVGANYGTPALDLLEEETPDYYLLELSSFQLETTTSLSPVVSVLLNLSPDHLDRYNSVEDYYAAKRRVYRGASQVISTTEEAANTIFKDKNCITFGFSDSDACIKKIDDEPWIVYRTQPIIAVNELQLLGQHNLSNTLAAVAIANALALPLSAVAATLKIFSGLPHRMELIIEKNGVKWINDSKATNVGSTTAALLGTNGPLVLLAGGEGKGADFTPLRTAVAQRAKAVILYGRDASLISTVLNECVPVYQVATLDDAVGQAIKIVKKGDRVLLSPACASFDLYDNYEQRGDAFKSLVYKNIDREKVCL
ncbi:UDP-N-acetylmuramoylalanine--D-glutamate ligase [hydrothermal vent metagenome]|uniref:UDP-N-acetylmuramoylalanine--D-glutamate ligase n=1 Tax=hydrothermal vent metagenome TaxID=652676 RepID=A0A3B0ZY71_9ZZZZ